MSPSHCMAQIGSDTKLYKAELGILLVKEQDVWRGFVHTRLLYMPSYFKNNSFICLDDVWLLITSNLSGKHVTSTPNHTTYRESHGFFMSPNYEF